MVSADVLPQLGRAVLAPLNLVLLALTLAALAAVGFLSPFYNWDLVPYVMASLDGADAAARHARTWELLQARLPDYALARLIDVEGTYRWTQYTDPAALASMLPFYEVKVAYVWLLRALGTVVDPITAVALLSVAGTMIVTVVLFLLCRPLPGVLALAWLPLAIGLDLVDAARSATPDALTAAAYAIGFVLLLRRPVWAAIALFWIGMLLRPDNIVLNGLLGLALALRAPLAAGVLIAGSIAIYLFASNYAGHIGWWPHFYFSFIDSVHDLRAFDPPFAVALYLRPVAENALRLIEDPWFAMPAVAALIGVALGGRLARQWRLDVLAAAVAAAFAAHFVIFPIWEYRVYLPCTVALVILAIEAARRLGREPIAVRAA